MDGPQIGTLLRAWRERLAPADVGMPQQARRRTPGLRREELAQLAGLSVDYLARLEQGRARRPSPQVLEALARALRPDDGEREHLFRLCGRVPPGGGRIDRRITPGVQRVLDRLTDLPVQVVDAAWGIVAWNPLAAALLGDPSSRQGRERNIAWMHFTGGRGRLVREEAEQRAAEEEVVADLHAALARYPEDEELRSLVADLRSSSARFETLWARRPVAVRAASRKTIAHPEVGLLTVDCDVLITQDSDLRLVVYSAPPDSPDAEALALVGVVGLQAL